MSSVDNRIVQMQFDNKQFEDGIKTSNSSLDRLKKALNLEESSKSLSNLQKVGKTFSLEGLSTGVDTIASKFTTLGIIGVTALVNITNSAINAGKSLISSLTVEPVMDGLREYETKMDAIQTIMTNTSSKGTTLDQVNKALGELNTYSDQTIYNFAQMTDNIGKMTAAGLGLKDSVTVVKGMSNVAAGFGVDATRMAGATYQMSQALSAGVIKLMDWKSLEQSGMGGEMLQKSLVSTAKSMGKVVDAGKPFRETLESGWLTTDVFVKTMDKMANNKALLDAAMNVTSLTKLIGVMKESVGSGWATSWENIFGNKDQSTKLFTSLNNSFSSLIGPSTDARNAMLAFWNANGGRAAIIQALSNTFKGLQAILKPIHDAFRDIFPAMTGQRLVEISKGIRDLTAHFKIGAENSANIKMSFKGLFAVLDIGVKLFKLAAQGVGLLIGALIPGTGSILEITAGIGKFLVSLDEAISNSDIMSTSLEGLGSAFTIVKNLISKAIVAVTPALKTVKDVLISLYDSINKLFTGTTVFAATLTDATGSFNSTASETNKLKSAFDALHKGISKVKEVISNIVKSVKSTLGPMLTWLKDKIDSITMQDVGALLTGGGFLIFAKALARGINSVDDIMDSFTGVLDQVGNTLKAFQLKVKAQALLKIAIALLVLAVALTMLSFIDLADLGKSLLILTIVLAELVGALILINKYVEDVRKVTGQLIALGVAMLLLAFAVKVLSSIDLARLAQATVAMAALMGMVALFIKITNGGDLKKSSAGLIGFSIGILILTGALVILGHMDQNKLIQAGVALATLMTVIGLFIKLTRGGDLAATAGGLIGFAIGITILAGALAIFGNMDPATLEQGGKALGGLMIAIAAFIKLTSGGDLATSAGGLIGFAIGILLLTKALSVFGNMDPKVLAQGSKALKALLITIAMFIKLTRGGDLATSAGGLIAFSVGILILTKALSILGNMEAAKLEQAIKAIAGLMLAIAAFITLTEDGDLKKSSAGLIAFSIGLTILSGAVYILAAIDPKRITLAVTAMMVLIGGIAAFIALTKAGDLKKSAEGLIKFSTGLMILAGVIAILSALDPKKLIMASAALSTLMVSIALFVKLSKGADLKKTAFALIGFSIGIGALALSLGYLAKFDAKALLASGAAISAILLSIVGFVRLTKGADIVISAAALVVFSGAIMVLTIAVKALGELPMMTIIKGIGGLAAMLIIIGLTSTILSPLAPAILVLSGAMLLFGIGCLSVATAAFVFANALTILSQTGAAGADVLVLVVRKMIALIPEILQTIAIGIIKFAETIGNGAPVIASAFLKVLSAILDTIIIATPKILKCVEVLLTNFLNFLVRAIPKMVDAGMKLVIGILNGISANIGKVINAAFNLIITFINGLANAIRNNSTAINNAMSNLITAIVSAIISFSVKMVNTGIQVVKDILKGIGQMRSAMFDAGVNAVKGFINGLLSMPGRIWDAGKEIANGALNAARRELDEHSPSKAFKKIGAFGGEGFVIGLSSYTGKAADAATTVGAGAIDAMSNAISGISDIVSSDIDVQPVIRPVMDLSNIQNGSKQLNGMVNKIDGYTVDGAVNMANKVSNSMNSSKNAPVSNTPINNAPTQIKEPSINNTFNITGGDPKEIANEVSRIIQRQVERRAMVWE